MLTVASSKDVATPAWRTGLAALSASAAVLLGALYGLGAAIEAARFAKAHVAALDALPLVPLPHLLTSGITLLLSTLLAASLVVLFLAGLYRLRRALAQQVWKPVLLKRKRKRTTRLMQIHHERDLATEEAERLTTLKTRVNEFAAEPFVPPTNDAERESARLRLEQGQKLIAEAGEQQETRAAALAHLKRLQRRLRLYPHMLKGELIIFRTFVLSIKYGPLSVALVAACFLPYPIGISLVLAGTLWRVALLIDDVRYVLLGLSALVSIGVITNGIISVPRLPIAQVRTDSGLLTGTLIALTDSTWYLGTPNGAIRPIPADQVREGFVRPVASPSTSSLGDLVLDAL
jgi:hypothetical protein